jgi:ankyrin repeat protein
MRTNGTQTLAKALITRDVKAVNDAIEGGADPNATIHGTRPLHIAVFTGSRELVEALLHNGGTVDVRDNLGRTPLHYAAIGVPDADPGIVRVLLDLGADANARDDNGCTPLDLAAGATNPQTTATLASAGGQCRTDRRAWVQQALGSEGLSAKPKPDRSR